MSTALPIEAGIWKLDAMHSQLNFTVRHLGISNVRGLFENADATVVVGDDGSATIEVEVQMNSVRSGNSGRDEHLHGEPFFDVANHPTLTFTSTSIEMTDASNGTIHGDLTIRGVTKPVAFATMFNGTGTFPMNNSFHAGFEASGTIQRSDFGVSYGIPMVSDNVKLQLDIQLVKS